MAAKKKQKKESTTSISITTGDIFTINECDVMVVETDQSTYCLIGIKQGMRFSNPVFLIDRELDFIDGLSVIKLSLSDLEKLVDDKKVDLIAILKTKRRI